MASRIDENPWALAQDRLKQKVDQQSYAHWLRPLDFLACEGDTLVLTVPNQFHGDWVRANYIDQLREAVRQCAPGISEVALRASSAATPPPGDNHGHTAAPAAVHEAVAMQAGADARMAAVRQRYSGFNPKYTFDNFVIGSSNRFAHAAARAVADRPGRNYNPLFLYGATGLGKTHLMQAIGQHILARNPKAKCVFISSEQFTNQLIRSIAERSTAKFRDYYRKVDLLLVDDIQFLENKEATQEEFFHTFNELFDHHRQMVISSDRPPKELVSIEQRIVSRFESGVVTDIQPPDLETRMAILQNKAMRENVRVSDEVTRFIATYITKNIRELEGALTTVLAYSRLTELQLTIEMAQEVLWNLVGKEKTKLVTVEMVQKAVADRFDVRISDLNGRSRQRQIVRPRQIAMYACKELIPNLSLSDIGEAFGGKDHTTVLYGIEQVSRMRENDPIFRQSIEMLLRQILG
jgi:chromosomal replication initiator protein